jgi:hypothetical protein
MARIFISYKREERPTVEKLAEKIGFLYHDNNIVWYDKEIRGGVDWWQLILSKIAECEVFVYILTNASMQSPYCQAEMREALRLHKPILPIVTTGKRPWFGLLPARKTNLECLPDDLRRKIQEVQKVNIDRTVRHDLTYVYGALNELLAVNPRQFLIPLESHPTPEPPVPGQLVLSWQLWAWVRRVSAQILLVLLRQSKRFIQYYFVSPYLIIKPIRC